MLEVVPVINCHEGDGGCVAEKLRAAERFSEWVHVDVADARFTFNKTWADPVEWEQFQPKVKLEVHLMVEEAEREALRWLDAGAKRLIVHVETVNDASVAQILESAKKHGAEVMLASNPETSVEAFAPYLETFRAFQVLAVHNPGFAGQHFQPTVLEKVKFLRREVPDATIEVDGGVNPETARLAKDAGATVVASATYLWKSVKPGEAYEELRRA